MLPPRGVVRRVQAVEVGEAVGVEIRALPGWPTGRDAVRVSAHRGQRRFGSVRSAVRFTFCAVDVANDVPLGGLPVMSYRPFGSTNDPVPEAFVLSFGVKMRVLLPATRTSKSALLSGNSAELVIVPVTRKPLSRILVPIAESALTSGMPRISRGTLRLLSVGTISMS